MLREAGARWVSCDATGGERQRTGEHGRAAVAVARQVVVWGGQLRDRHRRSRELRDGQRRSRLFRDGWWRSREFRDGWWRSKGGRGMTPQTWRLRVWSLAGALHTAAVAAVELRNEGRRLMMR